MDCIIGAARRCQTWNGKREMLMHLPELLLVTLSLGCVVALAYASVRGAARLFARELARELRRQRGDGE